MADRFSKMKAFVFGPSAADDEDDFSSEYEVNEPTADEEITDAIAYAPEPRRAQDTATVTSLDQRRRMAAVQPSASLSEIVHVKARSFADAVQVGESFREALPVILNLTVTDEAQAMKLIDFCSGMAFVTGGTLEKITTRVFLLTPKSVKFTEADKSEMLGQQYLHS